MGPNLRALHVHTTWEDKFTDLLHVSKCKSSCGISIEKYEPFNDEPIGEYMSLILFGSKIDDLSPEYRRGRIRNSKNSEGSCSKRLNLDDIDELKEKIVDQDATTCVMDNEGVQGCYKPSTSNIDNIGEKMKGVQDNEHIEGCYCWIRCLSP
uniref:Uncharacterized protein n=1 Tax=Lactuca sativa TaxID=4236 RepID=A0A9R1XKA1_LACSA|nr:hypothetical protein LSAT_V11C400192550 [Lactuca sativa]